MSSRMGWKSWVRAVGAVTLSGSTALAQVSEEQPPYALGYSDFTVQLRPDVSTVVTGTWYQCTGAPACDQGTRPRRAVVAIPGLSHTAVT